MPLSTAYPLLEAEIFSALQGAGRAIAPGGEEGVSPSDINQQLATDLARAIHSYTMSAVVTTSVITVVGGIAAPLAPAGAAPVVAAGGGSGTGSLL
jgi:hypothetical protein